MPLTAESQAVLNVFAEQGMPRLHSMPAAESRAFFNAAFATKPEDQDPIAKVQDLGVPVADTEIPARLYLPDTNEKLPLLVHYHGGGWVLMNLESHDALCRTLANKAGVAILAVEYRKAPEYPYPTAVEDCYAALRWAAANADELGVDGTRLGVIGDSAGGNLASVVAQMARDSGGPDLRVQILTYPAVDATMAAKSIEENAEAPLLGRDEMRWFWDHYIGDHKNLKEPRLSPLYANSFDNLPPAYVSTAEFDPLRDEGEQYAEKLAAAGTEVISKRYNGVFHGFALLAKLIPEGAQLVEEQAAFVRHHMA